MIVYCVEDRRPLVLTQNGRGAAILLDLDTYQELVDDNDLLASIRNGLADVAAGRTLSQDDLEKEVAERYPL